jgi:hypothetical protein
MVGSTDTLQGLQDKVPEGPAKGPQIAAEARELFSRGENPPLMVSFCAADPPYHAAVLAWASVLMDMGLKVSIDTTHGPHPITGEHIPIIRGEAYPNAK